MDNWNIAEILRVGLAGLVFLLLAMAYRMLSQEQKKQEPSDSIIRTIKTYLWQSIIVAVIVGGFNIAEIVLTNRNAETVPLPLVEVCRDSLSRLETTASLPQTSLEDLKSAVTSHTNSCRDVLDRLESQ